MTMPSRRSRSLRGLRVAALLALAVPPLSALEPRLVANLDTSVPGVDPAHLGSGPEQFLSVGGRTLFLASTPEHGREPWVSDGTPEGTKLLVDACPGPADGVPGDLEIHHGRTTAFFVLPPCAPAASRVVWRTDGTTEGTRGLFAFDPFDDSSWSLIAAAGNNALVLHESFSGFQDSLLGVDGLTGAAQQILSPQQPFGRVVGTLPERMILAPINAEKLLASDGTAAGTGPVLTIGAQSVVGPGARFGDSLVSLASGFFDPRVRLLRTGGTAATSQVLAEIVTDGGFQEGDGPIVAGSERIFFLADPGDLWTSDGTPAGTHRVLDFGPTGSMVLPPGAELPGGRWLFFRGPTSESLEPWVTDGTLAGTFALGDFCPGTCGSIGDPRVVATRDRVIFLAFDGVHGTEPWGTDGTVTGTAALGDFCPGPCSPAVIFTASPGGDAWMIGAETFNPAPGDERRLLRTDGTAAGTRVVESFSDGLLTNLQSDGAGGVFFGRRSGDGVPELWRSTGSPGAAERLATFGASFREQGSEPRDLQAQAGRLLFAAHGDDQGDQIWTSDGTEAGTRALSAITGPAGTILATAATPRNLVAVIDQGSGGEWVAVKLEDGATTRLVGPAPLALAADSPLARLGAEVVAGLPEGGLAVTRLATGSIEILGQGDFEAIVGDPSFVSLGGRLYFLAASDGEVRLWQTDGTAAGTRRTLAADRVIHGVVALGDRLIVAERAPAFHEHILALVPRGDQPPLEAELGVVGRTLLMASAADKALIFFAEGGRTRLASTDGTPAGTIVLGPQLFTTWKSLAPRPVALGGTLFFGMEDLESGLELWRTDGTRLGTRRVVDLQPGAGGSHPTELRVVDDRLIFAATDGVHGQELWTTDGTAAGTHRLTDLAPGADSANPADFAALAPDLYFGATDGTVGRELWALPLVDLPAALPPTPSALWLSSAAVPGFRFQVRFDGGRLGRQEASCLAETLCVSGAVPGRPEVFLRVVGPKPNGFLWPTLVKFSTAAVEVWVEQPATGEIRHYQLPGARPGFDELPGLFDRQGFRPVPVPAAESANAGTNPERSDPEPPADGWFTTPAVPGFRIAVQIQGAPSAHQEPCIAETLCVSGALPGRPEVFVRVVGPKPNGRLWPTLVKFTTSEVEIWIEQLRTGETGERKYYRLPGVEAGSGVLSGLFDRVGFGL